MREPEIAAEGSLRGDALLATEQHAEKSRDDNEAGRQADTVKSAKKVGTTTLTGFGTGKGPP